MGKRRKNREIATARWSAFGVDENEGLALGQGLGGLFAGAGYDTLHGSPGDPHPHPGFLLGKALEIAEPECFEFIAVQIELMQLTERRSRRLEGSAAKIAFAMSQFFGAW